MRYIAESAGCFACAGRDGKIYFRKMGEDEAEIPIELFGEYKWGEEFKISKVSYEDGLRSFKFGDETRNTLWINQENMYIVDENQIENIYNEMKNLTINSFEGKTVIDPSIDIGDKIIIDGKPVIYQGDMSLAGRFIVDIKSKINIKQKQETTVKKESQKVINRKIQSEINQIDGKITQLVEENTETSNKLSQHEQTINNISQKIEHIEDLTNTIEGIKTITLENCVEGDLLELHIYGNNNVFKYLYPSNSLYPSDTLYPYGDSRIEVESFLNNSEEGIKEIYELGVLDILRQNGKVYDEFILEKGQAKVIRRVNTNGTIKEKETTEDLGELKVNLKEGTNVITIQNYSARLKAKFALKNNYTEIFATKVEMNSSITQTAEEINLEVKKKVNEDNIIASLNLSTEKEKDGSEMKLKANKIGLEGTVTANENFKIDEHGNMECKKATCDDIIIKNSTIREGFIELKSTNGSSSFSVTDTSTDRLNSELSASLLNFNSNLSRNVAQIGVDNASGNGFMSISGIAECGNLIQTSRKERKKYIKKITKNATDIIKNTDIYQYQLKGEKATGHRHYGVVINDEYNCPDEIKAENGKGVEIYSMISIAWKALQEQQEIITQLQERIKRLEEK